MTSTQENAGKERYHSWLNFSYAWVTRTLLRTVLRYAVRWRRQHPRRKGFSVVVGVPYLLTDLAVAPLLSIQRSRRTTCNEVLLVIDTTEDKLRNSASGNVPENIHAEFSDLNLRIIYYNKRQYAISRLIRWGWVDCWMTWILGISHSNSEHVLLHDVDAVLLDRDFMEKHYLLGRDGQYTYCGIWADRRYPSQKVPVLGTVELLLNAKTLLEKYKPIDLFNRVRMIKGLRLECDILRDCQIRQPETDRHLHQISRDQVFHPGQMVSQWMYLMRSKSHYKVGRYCPVLIVPYFRFVSGDPVMLTDVTSQLNENKIVLSIAGRFMDLSEANYAGLERTIDGIRRANAFFFQESVPPEVIDYIASLKQRAEKIKQGFSN